MAFELPPLPYPPNALAPMISQETIAFHYGKHHAAYVKNLNAFAEKDPTLAGKSLVFSLPTTFLTYKYIFSKIFTLQVDIILTAPPGPVFNNAAQVWNHTFYWHCLSPKATAPVGKLLHAIERDFGGVEQVCIFFSCVALRGFA